MLRARNPLMNNNLIEYEWWGKMNEPPEHFKTRKQLSELGLSPCAPRAIIKTKKYDVLLYDITDNNSVRAKRKISEQQRRALEKGRKKQAMLRELPRQQDYNKSVIWAKEIWEKDFVILDTETTGLFSARIVEIAVINKHKTPLLNTLINPEIPIPNNVTAIHGIDDSQVKSAPTFKEIYPQLKDVLAGKKVIIYNAKFDLNILKHCCKVYQLSPLTIDYDCLMLQYAIYYGEYYGRDYQWQKLEGNHRTYGDCCTALDLLMEMRDSEPSAPYPS